MSQKRRSMLHSEDSTNWAITLSDLLMQLVAFALVATAISSQATSAPARARRATVPREVTTPSRSQPVTRASASDDLLLRWDWPLAPRRIAQRAIPSSGSEASAVIARRAAPAEEPRREALPAPASRRDRARGSETASGSETTPGAETTAAETTSRAETTPASETTLAWSLAANDSDPIVDLVLPSTLLPDAWLAPSRRAAELVWAAPGLRTAQAFAPAASAQPVDAPSETAAALSLAHRFTELLRGKGPASLADVRVDGAAVVISLDHAISFASASAELRSEVLPVIEEIRGAVSALPDFAIEVAGHADDRPIRSARFASNLELSLARAAAVAHVLTAGEPELASRVFAAGYGERRPRDRSGGEAARAHNRRVEIRLSTARDALARAR